MSDAEREISDWLRAFEAACRGRDFDTGRRMFAPDALAYGTYATAVRGLENIEREQWRNVWPRIRGFRFEDRPFRRPGRGTFVLARRDGRWLCVHSHVSLLPSQSESAHGRL